METDMPSIANQFAKQAIALPFTDSVWASFDVVRHKLEIWSVINEGDDTDTTLSRYLTVANIESEFMRLSLPLDIDFHTVSVGADLTSYIPQGFMKVA